MRQILASFAVLLTVPLGAATAPPSGSLIITTPDGTGWVCLPPPTAEYAGLGQILQNYHNMVYRYADVVHKDFANNCRRQPGGSLGGDIETFDSTASFTLTAEDGTTATVDVPVAAEAHTGAQDPTARQQVIRTTMNSLQGSIQDTEDWDYLSVTAGDANGLPSPGSTTLTRLADGRVVVESQFDIHYRIEFRGAAGGRFAGLEGASEGSVIMRARPAGAATPPADRDR